MTPKQSTDRKGPNARSPDSITATERAAQNGRPVRNKSSLDRTEKRTIREVLQHEIDDFGDFQPLLKRIRSVQTFSADQEDLGDIISRNTCIDFPLLGLLAKPQAQDDGGGDGVEGPAQAYQNDKKMIQNSPMEKCLDDQDNIEKKGRVQREGRKIINRMEPEPVNRPKGMLIRSDTQTGKSASTISLQQRIVTTCP